MNTQEVTENLLVNGGDQKPKGNKKKRNIIIIAIIGIIIVALGIYGFIVYNNQQKYNKNLELGFQYLQDGNYADAIIAFNDAIAISDKEPEPYQGLVEAAIYTNDIPLAQEAYENLFRLTGDITYQYLENQVAFGNSNGNITNGGLVIQAGSTTYLADNSSNDYSYIWKIDEDGTARIIHAINHYSYFSNDNTTKAISSLNLYGDSLYYLNDDYIVKINVKTGQEEYDYNDLSKYSFEEIIIYNDKLYFTGHLNSASTGINSFYVSNLDGSNVTQIYSGSYINDFIIEDNNAYIINSNSYGENSGLVKVSLDNYNDTETIYSKEHVLINSFFIADNELYFSSYNSQYGSGNDTFNGDIIKINLDNNEEEILGSPGSVSSINTDGSNLYYVSSGKVYKASMNLENEELIGDVSKVTTNVGSAHYALNLSSNSLYVYSGTNTNTFTNIPGDDHIMKASLSSISDYAEFDPQLNYSSSGDNQFADNIKEAYKTKLAQVSSEEISKFPDQNNFVYYSLFDMNDDGIPELIFNINPGESCHYERYFTYKDGQVIDLGQTTESHCGFLGDGNSLYGSLILEGGHMDNYFAFRILLDNDKVEKEEILTSNNLDQIYKVTADYYYIPEILSDELYLLNH